MKRLSVLLILILSASTLSTSPASASYSSLSDVDDEVLFLGDILTIDAGWCHTSKKPSNQQAKKKLEIYKSGKWTSVGKTVFTKSDSCGKKFPYIQRFQWEVEELGMLNTDQISGKLRIRNTSVRPTLYAKVIVFESVIAYQAKLKAEKEAAEKATVERIGGYMAAFNCVVQGGEWNSQGNYCVPPKP